MCGSWWLFMVEWAINFDTRSKQYTHWLTPPLTGQFNQPRLHMGTDDAVQTWIRSLSWLINTSKASRASHEDSWPTLTATSQVHDDQPQGEHFLRRWMRHATKPRPLQLWVLLLDLNLPFLLFDCHDPVQKRVVIYLHSIMIQVLRSFIKEASATILSISFYLSEFDLVHNRKSD